MLKIKKSDEGKAWARKRIGRRKPAAIEIRRRILIVSEDKKSSCYYFRKYAEEFLPGYVSVCVCGLGESTMRLVQDVPRVEHEQLEILEQSGVLSPHFDEIWVVFDKDDFEADAFDNAVAMADGLPRCHAAWSNECFEYWYLLHFNNYTTGMKRTAIYEKLEALIPRFKERFPDKHYPELKGESGRMIHEELAMMTENRKQAIKRAESQESYWTGGVPPKAPHEWNPATRVYQLVRSLDRARSIGELAQADIHVVE